MMTLHDMFCAANRAYNDGRRDEAKQWVMLARLIDETEARARLAIWRDPDQQDDDEYNFDMSLGGRRYRRR